jgi:ribosome-associated toxin RatA of RatAB toxin-antitoxin module
MNIQEAQIIPVDQDQLFTYLSDVSKRIDYIPMLEDLILLDEPPIKLGSRYIEVANIAGRQLKTTYQVVELQAPERIKVKTIKSVFPIEASLQLEERSGATLLTLELNFSLSGIYKLGAPVVRGIVQQQAKDILGRLEVIFKKV